MIRSPDDRARRGAALAWVVGVVAVVGLSAAIVAWHARAAAAPAQPARYPAGLTVLDLASVLPPARLDAPVTVAVIRDPASLGYFDQPATLDSTVDAWVHAARDAGATARVVSPAELARGIDARVLVLPRSPCVSSATRRALDRAVRERRGIIVTWLTGISGDGCAPAGYGLLERLTGAERVDTLEPREVNYVAFPDGSPLAAGLPPGARLEVLRANHAVLREPGRDAYWADFMLNPLPAGGTPLLDAAVTHSTTSGTRAVFWGFDLLRVAPRPWDRELARHLVRNSIAWAAGMPVASVAPWPRGRLAAAVVAQDVEDQFANARFAADTLRAAGVRGTYYLVSELALQHPDVARKLAAEGEVGSHSENHRLLGGLAPDIQARRLATTQRELTKLFGHPVRGFRPPEEQFDDATLTGWYATGGRYLFGSNNARTASPELLALGRDTVVLLARIINDDFITVRRAGLRDPARLAAGYLDALDKVRALGGLYMLSYHSQMLSRPALVPALGRIARALAADSTVWVATGSEVASWWRARAALGVSARRDATDRVTVTVTNRGPAPVDGAVVRVVLPMGARPVGASGATLLASSARVPDAARLALPVLAPGATMAVTISLASDGRAERGADGHAR